MTRLAFDNHVKYPNGSTGARKKYSNIAKSLKNSRALACCVLKNIPNLKKKNQIQIKFRWSLMLI